MLSGNTEKYHDKPQPEVTAGKFLFLKFGLATLRNTAINLSRKRQQENFYF
jgi:hypothetical protein